MSDPIRRGVIRVDATRAAEKIREHLLAEPEAWLAEVVRAAALAGATRVDVTYDADDLYVAFDGAPWPRRVVEQLETCVVADGETPRAARMLAVGAFAAIGHEARMFELVARAEDGSIASRRYVRPRGDDGVQASTDEVSRGLEARLEADRSLLIHVRRGPSFAVLARFLGRFVGDGAPPELELLRDRLRSDAVPVFVDGAQLVRKAPDPEIVCSAVVDDGPLGVRLELLATAERGPTIELRELGVVVGHADWPSSWLNERGEAGHVPLRVIVSSAQLPTNVSRSKLRDEAMSAVVETARRGLAALIDAARAGLEDAASGRAVAEAIAPLAVAYVRALQEQSPGHEADSQHAQALLDLRLLASATGEPRPLRALSRDRRVVVRAAKAPLPEAYAPVSGDVFWRRPNHAIDVLLDGIPHEKAEADLEVGAARAAEAALRPAEPFGLPVASASALRGCVTHTDGFVAEIALRTCSDAPPTVQVFVDGRRFCEIGARMRALPLDAVIAWPGRIEPDIRYERLSCEATVTNLVEGKLQYAAFDILASATSALAGEHAATLRTWSAFRPRVWRTHGAARLPIWPAFGRKPLSTVEVIDHVAKVGWFRWIRPESAVGTWTGAPILVLEAADLAALRAHFTPDVVGHDYSLWMTRPSSNPERVRALLSRASSDAPIVESNDGLRLLSRVSSTPAVLHVHRGEVVTRAQTRGGVSHAVESDELPPIPGAKVTISDDALEKAAVEAIEATLVAIERGKLDLARDFDVRDGLACAGVRHLRARRSNARFRSLPLFELIEGPSSATPTSRWVSGAELGELFPDGVPWASMRAAWRESFVYVDEEALTLLARLSGRALRSLAEESTIDVASRDATLRALARLSGESSGARVEPSPPRPARALPDRPPPPPSPPTAAPARSTSRPITEAMRDLFTPEGNLFVDPRATLAIGVLEGLGLASVSAEIADREGVGPRGRDPMAYDGRTRRLVLAERHPVIAALAERGDAANLAVAVIVAVGARDDAELVASMIGALTSDRLG